MSSPETHFLLAMEDAGESDLIRGVLEKEGYLNITRVVNGQDALRLARNRTGYFVIASWDLPNLGGLRLTREVRKNEHSADWPCLLVVPKQHDSELEMSQNVGVTGFLTRPLSATRVATKIGDVQRSRDENDWPRQADKKSRQLLDAEQPREALKALEKSLGAGRQRMAALHTEIGSTLLQRGRVQEALDNLEQAALLDPYRPRAQAMLGRALLAQRRPAEAGRALQRAAGLDPLNTDIQRDLAESLLHLRDFGRAEAIYRKLLEKFPDDLHLLNRMGIALRQQKKHKEALRHYHHALKINDKDENLYFNLARCYQEIGRTDQALTAINQSLNLNPKFEKARQFVAKLKKPV